MPKLKNFTKEEVATVNDAADTVTHQLHELTKYVEQGYCDELEKSGEIARTMLCLSLAAGRAAQLLLHKDWMQAQTRELEALRARKTA